MSIEYFLTSLVVILLPGSGVLYTMAIGHGRGFKPSVAAALGCTVGIVPAAIASIVGLAAVFHASALAFLIIKYSGVAYLLYMAWNILKDDGILSLKENKACKTYLRTVVDGTLLNFLNPKLSLFFLAFLPQFVPPEHSGSVFFMAYRAALFMAMTFVVFVLYGAFASSARKYIVDSPAILVWIRRVLAGTFGFLSLRLALALALSDN